jgi:outer membrane protein assembly factor BamD
MQKILLKFTVLAIVFLVSACSSTSGDDETKDWAASKLYSEAMEDLNGSRYERAVQLFEKLESRYPFGPYAQQAQMEIAYAYYRQHDQPQALAEIDRFIKSYPTHPNADYMYYLRGLVDFNDKVSYFDFVSRQDPSERDPKAARDSFDSFKQLVEHYPDSIYNSDARGRLKYLIGALSKYEVHVASYYFRREAYVAAVNRAQAAVKEYPGTPANEEALYIMMKAYDALKLPDLRDDAERVLRKNYPDSVFFKGGPDRDDPWWKIW